MAIQETDITLDGLKHTTEEPMRKSAQLVAENDNTFTGANTFHKLVYNSETVAAGNGGGSATALSLTAPVSFVTTATNSSHVSLADGVTGQVKVIVHKTRSNTTDLVITPANFAAGTALTSNLGSRSVVLCFDGTNWQVIGGEITGTAEMVIS